MIFEKKKIQLETLGEYLAEIRQNSGLSLKEAAGRTGIKPKFLQALEAGDLAMLPPEIYVCGFLKQLGQLYNVEAGILIQQYKKEINILRRMKSETQQTIWFFRFIPRLVITPKSLTVFVGLLLFFFSLGYIFWQVVSINRTPSLEIFQPKDQQAVFDTSVDVVGKTNPDIKVSVNGQNVFVDENGNFKTQIGLAAGPEELVVTAQNRFGKSVSKTLVVIGEQQASQAQGKLELSLNFSAPVALTLNLDNQPPQNLNFLAGDSRIFDAQSKITLTTTDAGATHVVLNGRNLGAMGRKGEKLENVPFFAESGSINNSK